MLDVTLAIAHHLVIFTLFGILAAELISIRPGVSQERIATIARIDIWYGVMAVGILVVGFWRAIYAAKGWAYYSHNEFFWAKVGTFLVIALLSALPTIQLIRWQRLNAQPAAAEVRLVQRFLNAELVLFALLPIFAALMARGYGEL